MANRKERRAKEAQRRKQAAAATGAAASATAVSGPVLTTHQTAPAPTPSPASAPQKSPRVSLIGALSTWFASLSSLAKFLWGMGVFSFCLTVLGIASDLTQLSALPIEPEVEAQAVQVEFPFDATFTVLNRSALFDLRWVEVRCIHNDTRGSTIFQGISTSIDVGRLQIGTGDRYLYKCPMTVAEGAPRHVFRNSDIDILVKYKTLAFHREVSKRFQWNEHTRQWIKAN